MVVAIHLDSERFTDVLSLAYTLKHTGCDFIDTFIAK